MIFFVNQPLHLPTHRPTRSCYKQRMCRCLFRLDDNEGSTLNEMTLVDWTGGEEASMLSSNRHISLMCRPWNISPTTLCCSKKKPIGMTWDMTCHAPCLNPLLKISQNCLELCPWNPPKLLVHAFLQSGPHLSNDKQPKNGCTLISAYEGGWRVR